MPVARFQMPDGRVGRFEVPGGTTPEQAQQMIQTHIGQQQQSSVVDQPAAPAPAPQSVGGDVLKSAGIGVPKGIIDLAGTPGNIRSTFDAGVKKLLGFAGIKPPEGVSFPMPFPLPDPNLVPNMINSAAGRRVVPNIDLSSAGIQNAIEGVTGKFYEPKTSPGRYTESVTRAVAGAGPLGPLKQLPVRAITAAAGGAGAEAGEQATGTPWGRLPGALLASTAAGLPFTMRGNANVPQLSEAAQAAAKLGLKVPKSNIKQTIGTNLLERAGGKEAIESTARLSNQPVVNRIAAKSLGLADDAPLTKEVLQGLRDVAGKSYEAVAKTGPIKADNAYAVALKKVGEKYSGASKDFPELADKSVSKLLRGLAKKNISSDGAVEMVKNLRNLGNANIKSMVPADKLLGRAQRAAAESLDDLIGRNLKAQGNPQVYQAYQKSRELIAKTYSVENSLNPGTGNVVLSDLAKQLRKGVPLSGDLKELGTFASGFPRMAREQTSAVPGGGLFEPLVYGTAGTLTAGPPGLAASLLPIIGKPLARKFGSAVPKITPQSSPTTLKKFSQLVAGDNPKAQALIVQMLLTKQASEEINKEPKGNTNGT